MKSFSRVQLLVTSWTAACQAPPSMGFSRQEYWSGPPVPSQKHTAGLCKERIFQVQELKYLNRLHPAPNLHTQDIQEPSQQERLFLLPQSHSGQSNDINIRLILGFPGNSDSKESACNAGAPGSIPGLGRSSGGRNVYPFQYSCLENSMDRGAW